MVHKYNIFMFLFIMRLEHADVRMIWYVKGGWFYDRGRECLLLLLLSEWPQALRTCTHNSGMLKASQVDARCVFTFKSIANKNRYKACKNHKNLFWVVASQKLEKKNKELIVLD